MTTENEDLLNFGNDGNSNNLDDNTALVDIGGEIDFAGDHANGDLLDGVAFSSNKNVEQIGNEPEVGDLLGSGDCEPTPHENHGLEDDLLGEKELDEDVGYDEEEENIEIVGEHDVVVDIEEGNEDDVEVTGDGNVEDEDMEMAAEQEKYDDFTTQEEKIMDEEVDDIPVSEACGGAEGFQVASDGMHLNLDNDNEVDYTNSPSPPLETNEYRPVELLGSDRNANTEDDIVEDTEEPHQDMEELNEDIGRSEEVSGSGFAHEEVYVIDNEEIHQEEPEPEAPKHHDPSRKPVGAGGSDTSVEKSWNLDIKNMATTYSGSSSSKGSAAFSSIPPEDMCYSCGRRVYPMEKLIADKHTYHKTCFKCEKCKRTLCLGNFTMTDNRLYCQPHFMELFKIRGRYDDKPVTILPPMEKKVAQNGAHKNNEASRSGDIVRATPPEDVIRSGEPAGEDELPPPAYTKNILAKFREMEAHGGTPEWKRSRENSPLEERRNSPADVVRCDEPGPDERPAPQTAKSMTAMFRALEQQGPAPTPESSSRQMKKAREHSGANANIRLPGATGAVHHSPQDEEEEPTNGDHSARNWDDEIRTTKDETVESEPAPTDPDVIRGEDRPGEEELPERGTTAQLLARFRAMQAS